jgi:tripartite-type tricarboxylate transporter receptor subunit TctC
VKKNICIQILGRERESFDANGCATRMNYLRILGSRHRIAALLRASRSRRAHDNASNLVPSGIQPNLPFNVNDFVPIGFVGEVPMAIAASRTLPVNSLSEMVAYSKRQTGGLNVAIGQRAGIPHLTAELLRARSGAELTSVLYPSGSQAMNDLISGRVPIGVEGLAGPMAAGQLKLLAVASVARLVSRPDLPTVAETLPGFAASGWFALVAPPATPAAVKKVSDDLRSVLTLPEVKQRFDALSVSTRAMSPQELSQFIRSERHLWKPVIKQAGLGAVI